MNTSKTFKILTTAATIALLSGCAGVTGTDMTTTPANQSEQTVKPVEKPSLDKQDQDQPFGNDDEERVIIPKPDI